MELKVIDMLYNSAISIDSSFREAIPEITAEEEKINTELDNKILEFDKEKRREIDELICEIRCIYEKMGFVSGLRTGVRLAAELAGKI